jgi:PhoH-like ATPase
MKNYLSSQERHAKKDNRCFILDTNVLLYHEDSIHGFPGRRVAIPIEVLEEIDTFKNKNDSVGNSARYVNRFLDSLRKKGNLNIGVELDNEQFIFVSSDSDMSLLPDGMKDTVDNRIISIAMHLKESGMLPIVITRDISLRVRCDSLDIDSENYIKEKATVSRKGAYTGVSVLNISGEDIDLFYKQGFVKCSDIGEHRLFYPNECIVLKSSDRKSALATHNDGMFKKLYTANGNNFSVQGIMPRSKEQRFACELLLNPAVHMVTLTGKAGSGKTLMSVACAVHMLAEKRYDKIIISRPVQSMSKDIGYLPGTKEEKMAPWIQPIFDNFKHIFKNSDHYLDLLLEKKKIEVEALTYIRGRSIPNAIFILDEAQNITLQEAKAVLTRMGEGSKLVLLGDLHQIDSPHMDTSTSGLATVSEMFKDFGLSGHITLLKGERSLLATHAAEIM